MNHWCYPHLCVCVCVHGMCPHSCSIVLKTCKPPLINVNPKVVCFDCCGGAHLDLCSNAVSLGSILYSLGLKDYGLAEQSGKHVNNLVGLHSACSLWHTQRATQYNIVCCAWIKNHRRACASKSHALSRKHRHTLQDHKHTFREIVEEEKPDCTHQQSLREQLLLGPVQNVIQCFGSLFNLPVTPVNGDKHMWTHNTWV